VIYFTWSYGNVDSPSFPVEFKIEDFYVSELKPLSFYFFIAHRSILL